MISQAVDHALKISLVAAAIVIPSAALASTCKIENTSPHGEWKFIRAYDVLTGKEVLSRAILGGASVEVTVTGTQIRLEYKLAGHRHYGSSVTATCKDGNTLRT